MKRLKEITAFMLAAMILLATSSCGIYDLPDSDKAPESSDNGSDAASTSPTPLSQSISDGRFTLYYNPESSLNPYSVQSATNFRLTGLMFESLFTLNEDFSYEPLLCESAETTDGGYSWSLKIKTGIAMHDGSELSIFDVIYSIRLAKESARYSKRFANVSQVDYLDGSVYVTLDAPNTDFCALLDIPVVKDGTGYGSTPVGTGPYVFDDTNEAARFLAFDSYRDRATVPVDVIYLEHYETADMIEAFDTGKIDLAVAEKSNISYLDYGGDCELRYCPTTVLHYIGFNSARGYCSSAMRRLILSSALDRDLLADGAVAGTIPTVTPLNPGFRYFSETAAANSVIAPENLESIMIRTLVEDYDQDGYLEYIEENTVTDFALEFIVNNDNMQKVSAARKITTALRALGFDIKLVELDWSAYLTRLNTGSYDLFYGELQLGANFDLSPLLCYGGAGCYGFYDPTLQNYVYVFNSASEETKKQAAEDMLIYLADNCYLAPMMFERTAVYSKRGVISNASPTAHNVFSNIAAWTINLS